MSSSAQVTISRNVPIVGNLTSDPELRFTQGGYPVVSIRVAQTDRVYDKEQGEYRDGETLFITGSVWRKLGENTAESLQKGAKVIAVGDLVQRSYETKEGETRTVVELTVKELGASLSNATVAVTKNEKPDESGGGKRSESKPTTKRPTRKAPEPEDDEPAEDEASPF